VLVSAEAIDLNNNDSSPVPLIAGDTSLNITSTLLYSQLHGEIHNLLKGYNEYGMACVRSATMKKFVEKMYQAHYNTISSRSKLVQELFLLHQICKAFYSYNHKYLNLSHQEFRAKVLYPNIVYALVRYFNKAHKFFRSNLESVYSEYKNQNYGIIQRYASSYYLDHEIIRMDVLYEFLGNALKQFNPLTLDNVTHFYKSVFRNIFNYYFRKNQEHQTSYSSFWDIDSYASQIMNTPTRLAIYRDVLYKLQVERFCQTSPTLLQLNYNFHIFKNVIVGNEFQNLFFSTKTDVFMMNDEHYKLMKVYQQDDDKIISEIKKLPIIYKLLKCVHIINPKSKPFNEMLIKPDVVKVAVLEELLHPFKNMLSDEHIYPILEKISNNFVRNVLSGEYINLLTLSNVRITQISFITQVRKLIQLCLSEIF